MSHRSLVALLSLVVAPPALAFAPTTAPLGSGTSTRIHAVDPATQVSIRDRASWQRFEAAEGSGWQARFDEKTGTPLRMWGGPIDIGPTATEKEVFAGLIDFVDAWSDVLGTDASELVPKSARYFAPTDTWYVDLDVVRGGLRLLNGGVTARVRHGRLVMLGAETYPGLSATAPRRLARAVAVDLAVRQGPAPLAVHREDDAELGMVAVEEDGVVSLRPAWRTTTTTGTPVGRWESVVDAETGALIASRNDIRFIEGTIHAEYDERTVGSPIVTGPLGFAAVHDGTTLSFADAAGGFAVDADSATVRLDSFSVHVYNDAGDEAVWPLVEGPNTLVGETEAVQAQLDTYVFLRQVQAWGDAAAPGVYPGVTANVNVGQTCNAYYDGRSVNFFQSGNGCNNTGRIADIVYHEWGHGLHDHSILSGVFDGSLSEGAADAVSFLQTGDHVIAPNFQRNGRSIRDVEPDRRYPDHYVASDNYVHSNGLIFAGAIWDLWGDLTDLHGAEEGRARTERIFLGVLRGGPDVPGSYDEAVFADDDDGDLSNGTPNLCALVDAFGIHGLGPKANGGVVATHEPDPAAEAGLPHIVVVDFDQQAPECFTATPVGGTVHYRVNSGAWAEVPLDLGQVDAIASIPPQRMGDLVSYWLEVDDSEGGTATSPAGGPIAPFTYYVGDVVPVTCTDFEADDGGFTHELVSGEAIEGADDWQWGRPRGLSGDPADAYDGTHVWGNDLGGGDFNGAYQGDRYNRLLSPVIDLAHYEGSFLHYQRWLTVEDGVFDDARIVANDTIVWSNYDGNDNEHTVDRQWMPHAVALGDVGPTVQIAWELESDEGLNMGGWNIDSVCVLAPATPDNRLGISDFTAEGNGDDGIRFGWTHPRHAPVTEVVVVRRADRFPEGPRDGDVVLRVDDPALGQRVEHTESGLRTHKDWYYAVYASDGETWLSWTVPGWNAAAARVDGQEIGTGCGCDAPGLGMTAWPGLALAGLLIRRRRR